VPYCWLSYLGRKKSYNPTLLIKNLIKLQLIHLLTPEITI
jgi:hypothetical protein